MWCEICLEAHGREDMYTLSCGHSFCKESLLTAYEEGEVDPACPMVDCRKRVEQGDLTKLLGQETARRIQRRRIQLKIYADEALRLCPTESCVNVLKAGRKYSEAFCDGCKRVVVLDELPVIDSVLTSTLGDLGIRICGVCGNGVEKKDGCDKMMCRCGAKFCFRCGLVNATCKCTSDAHIFWNNITGAPEGATFKVNTLNPPGGPFNFRRKSSTRSSRNAQACCVIA